MTAHYKLDKRSIMNKAKKLHKAASKKQQKIAELLENPAIWQVANHTAHTSNATQSSDEKTSVSTGFKSLNTALTQQGWPLGQLIECLTPSNTRGELALFLPAIQQLNQHSQRPIVLIAPPYIPNKAVWEGYMTSENNKVTSTPLWFIRSKNLNEQLWATEQTLQSGCASTVICWLNGEKIRPIELKKLQLASRQHSHSLSIIMRNSDAQSQPSPATLRLCLAPYLRPALNRPMANNLKANNQVQVKKPVNTASKVVAPQSNPLAHKYRSLHAQRPTPAATPPTDLAITIIKQAGSWQRKEILIPWHRNLQRAVMPVSQWPYHQSGQTSFATAAKSSQPSIAVASAKHTDV